MNTYTYSGDLTLMMKNADYDANADKDADESVKTPFISTKMDGKECFIIDTFSNGYNVMFTGVPVKVYVSKDTITVS